MKTAKQRMIELLTRKQGCTSLELVKKVPSMCIHKRISDLRGEYLIVKKDDPSGYIRYFAKPLK